MRKYLLCIGTALGHFVILPGNAFGQTSESVQEALAKAKKVGVTDCRLFDNPEQSGASLEVSGNKSSQKISPGFNSARMKGSNCGGDPRIECNPALKAWYGDVGNRILLALQAEPNALAFTGKNQIHCTFMIDEAGKVSNLKIVQSSNSKDIDQIALRVIETSAPFKSFTSWTLTTNLPAKKMVVWFFTYPSFSYWFDSDHEIYAGRYGHPVTSEGSEGETNF